MKVIYFIADTQVKPGVRNPLVPLAYHICEVKPNYIVHIGDHFDFPSLSKYDKGKKSHRVKTYRKDVEAGNDSLSEFFEILDKLWPEHENVCEKHFFNGNHEHRRDRAMEYGPDELIDLMDMIKPDLSRFNYVHPFLKIHKIEGINFCHYFQQDKSSNPIGTAKQILSKRHKSCVAGHSQGFDYAEALTADGDVIQCLINGACYFHEEEYKGHTNHHFRGSTILFNVNDGRFDFSRYSLTLLDSMYCKGRQ